MFLIYIFIIAWSGTIHAMHKSDSLNMLSSNYQIKKRQSPSLQLLWWIQPSYSLQSGNKYTKELLNNSEFQNDPIVPILLGGASIPNLQNFLLNPVLYSRWQSLWHFPKPFFQGFNLLKAKQLWKELQGLRTYGENFPLKLLYEQKIAEVVIEKEEIGKPLNGLSIQQWRARLYGFTTCLTLLGSSAVAGIIYCAAKALNTFSRS